MTEFEIHIEVVEKTTKLFGGGGAVAKHKWIVVTDYNAQKILQNVLQSGNKAEF